MISVNFLRGRLQGRKGPQRSDLGLLPQLKYFELGYFYLKN